MGPWITAFLVTWGAAVPGAQDESERDTLRLAAARLEALLAAQPCRADFGLSIARTADFDGDGLEDFAASACGWTRADGRRTGAAMLVSTRTGDLIRCIEGDEDGEEFGWVTDVGDADGDGVRDLAIGSKRAVTLVSGASGEPRWSAVGYRSCIGPIGDLDGDGVPDLLLGTWDRPAARAVVDGASGAVIRRLEQWETEGVTIAGDVDGDGISELISSGESRLELLDLKRDVARSVPAPEERGSSVRATVLRCAEGGRLAIGFPCGANAAGVVRIYELPSLDLVSEVSGLSLVDPAWPSEPELGSAVCALDDQDGDGCEELLVTAPGHAWLPSLECRSGRTGARLWSLRGTWRFGSDVVRIADLDGDGRDDLLVSQWNRGWEGPTHRIVHLVGSGKRALLLRIRDRSAAKPKDCGEK